MKLKVYKCNKCGNKMSFKSFWRWFIKGIRHLDIGGLRYIKCEHCGKHHWAKKLKEENTNND